MKALDDDLVLKVSPAKQCQPLVLHSFTIPDGTQSVCDRSGCPTLQLIFLRSVSTTPRQKVDDEGQHAAYQPSQAVVQDVHPFVCIAVKVVLQEFDQRAKADGTQSYHDDAPAPAR